MRRAKHAAMLLTMATAMGWSAPSGDAWASRGELAEAAGPTAHAVPTMAALGTDENIVAASGEWRYIPARR